MTRLRIALVTFSLDILGGQGVQARALEGELRKDGYDVRVIPFNPRFPRPLRRLRQYPYARTLLNEALYLPSLRHLRDADVVHVFSASYWSFLLAAAPALAAARSFGKRVVLNYHSGEADDHLTRFGALVHPWLRLADAIVVPSEYLRGVFARHGYRVEVVPNVVDVDRFTFRERTSLRPRLLSNRNLEAHYRVEDTIAAHAELLGRHDDSQLLIAGTGCEERRLRRLASAAANGSVRFVGRVEPALMPSLYDASDVFVNASVIDNQPLSVLEAFASGVPVVTTPTGDLGAMVTHDETGLIVPPRNPAALAGAVETLLHDPPRARRMAAAARSSLERFRWPSVRDGWARVYGAVA